MAGDTLITVIGNLTGDPELRFTPSGAAVANFSIASTPRAFDRANGEWKDGDTLFLRCSIWRESAENVAESLVKGMRVIAQGRLVQRNFETREGEKRSVIELQVEEIGPSLRYASAKVTRTGRGGGQGGQGGQGGYSAPGGGGGHQGAAPYGGGQAPSSAPAGQGYGGAAPAGGPSGYGAQGHGPADDPWATPGVAGPEAEPPF
ncbi:MAG: single-stranded DNA-binding protein [Bifidobacteriaceae bacterium]|jgi:single-strand DNA-binding protein|nr:single-stranded DNA-binding protein [Bifidobacteriaceae bacterium]